MQPVTNKVIPVLQNVSANWSADFLLVLVECCVSSSSWCPWSIRGGCGSWVQFLCWALMPFLSTSAMMTVRTLWLLINQTLVIMFPHYWIHYSTVLCLKMNSECLLSIILRDFTSLLNGHAVSSWLLIITL